MLRTIFPKKAFTSFGSSNFRKNSAMKDLMKRPEFQSELKTSRQKEEFFNRLKTAGLEGDRGLTQRELKPLMETLKHDHSDHLTDKAVDKLSRSLFNRRTGTYIEPKDQTSSIGTTSSTASPKTNPDTPTTPPSKRTSWF